LSLLITLGKKPEIRLNVFVFYFQALSSHLVYVRLKESLTLSMFILFMVMLSHIKVVSFYGGTRHDTVGLNYSSGDTVNDFMV
jgi:hypothetical protein